MVFSHWDCSLTRNTGFCLRTKDILCITLSGKRLNVVYVVIDFISLQTRELWFARKNAVSNQERRHFPEKSKRELPQGQVRLHQKKEANKAI